MGDDGSVIMVGDAGHTPTYAAAVKFDENGTLLWEWQVFIVVTAGKGMAVLLANCGRAISHELEIIYRQSMTRRRHFGPIKSLNWRLP